MTRRTYRIGDLCSLVKGEYATMKTEPGDYPLVVTAAYRRSASTYQLEGPAVCVPLVSSTGHGDAAIHRLHYQDGKFALANLLVALLPKEPVVCLPRYLYLLLNTRKDELFVPLMKGTANVSLKTQDIAEVEVSLPPFTEQRRIVAKIDRLAEKIEEARKLMRGVGCEVTSLVLSIHFNLAGNRQVKIGDILTLDETRVPISAEVEYPQVGIKSFGGGLFFKPAVLGAWTTYKHFNRLEGGLVVLSQVKGWEGAIAVCPDDCAGWFSSPEYRTFRCIEGCSLPEYMKSLVVTPWFQVLLERATRGVGARRERVRPERFLDLTIPMPRYDQQQRAAPLFERLRLVPRLQAKTAAKLDALLPSILDKAFKGEL